MRQRALSIAGARVDTPSNSFIQQFSRLAGATPRRGRDLVLRGLDILLSVFFLLVSLPLTTAIALVLLVTGGPPLFYRGERVGRGGRIFEMCKFRPPRRGAEARLGPYPGEEVVG